MGDVLLPKEYEAGAAVLPRRFVKFDGSGLIIQAAAATDNIIGVSASGVTAAELAAGKDRIRVDHIGKVDVDAGAAITRGSILTADANGKVIEAAPAAGVNNAVGGRLLGEAATAEDDIVPMLIGVGQVQGA